MPINQKTNEILSARKLDGTTIDALGWRSSGDWLEIPVLRDGVEVGFKRRKFGADKAFTQNPGTPQIFYNIDALNGATEVVITEGEMDCCVALQCGYLAVSVPNGAPSSRIEGEGPKYAYLDDFPPDAIAVLAVDSDGPGSNLLHDLSQRLGTKRCKWVKYPKGCKDLNETLVAYGTKGVHETMNRARWVDVPGLRDMFDFPPPPDLEKRPCPVAGMGDNYQIRLGDLTVITGIPSYGKTTFTNEVMAFMARNYAWNVLVGSFEQSPRVDHLRNLRTLYHGRPAHLQAEAEHAEADRWISSRFKFIAPDMDTEAQLAWVLNCVEAGILRYGCKLVIIDPWNELDHDRPPGMSLTEYTGFAIKQFKKLAQRMKVHVIIVAHPAKMLKNKDGTYPVPSLYDISDSAHWYNKPDLGIVIHREDDGITLAKVAKCRYRGIIGQPSETRLRFDDHSNRYTIA